MKKLFAVMISLLMVIGMSACSVSKGSISGISQDENTYVVTFENASKDMSVSTEATLGENQVFGYFHQLDESDSVKIDFIDANGESAMDLDVSDGGGGQSYLAPGTYTIEITVLDKANGTLTITVEDIQNDNQENPWKMTEDMQEALDATGIKFHSPIAEALPGDVEYAYSFYTEDIFQVNYRSDANELFFRVSKNHEGKEDLAGDYNEYAKTWHESVKGLDVTCYGDDD
ncbi:MAG: hypothetical protein J6Z03_10165, partial [Erysipelotrichaceae bacterium]|nr:hypothetical protein [Erysipelotrichaceae bacterium]